MHFEIEKARAIKPMVIRFSILMFDESSNLLGEFEIAVDIDSFVTYDITEGKTNININAAGIQQQLTTDIAEMQITSYIANGFNGLEWDASEEDESSDETEAETKTDESEPATGDTIKLQPVLSEGN